MRTPSNETLTSDTVEEAPEFDQIGPGGAHARGPAARRSVPMRKCVITGRIAPRDTLVRLAVGPGGPDGRDTVMPDAHAKAPGRGAWIGVSRAELEDALANGHLKGALARGFKSAPPAIPDDLADRIQAALMRAFADRLGIEYRSGNVLAGSDRIAEAARSGKISWLAHALDAGGDGTSRLNQAWRVGEDMEGSGKAGITLPLDRTALSVALGRNNTVHLALTDRAAAGRVTALLTRLNRFLGFDPEDAGTQANAIREAPGSGSREPTGNGPASTSRASEP